MAAADILVAEREREQHVLRRIARRFLWFLFILLVINFLDRTNIGFAALTMNRDLGLSASVFGIAVSVFSAGYMLFEIPSNLILARVGARTGCRGSSSLGVFWLARARSPREPRASSRCARSWALPRRASCQGSCST